MTIVIQEQKRVLKNRIDWGLGGKTVDYWRTLELLDLALLGTADELADLAWPAWLISGSLVTFHLHTYWIINIGLSVILSDISKRVH